MNLSNLVKRVDLRRAKAALVALALLALGAVLLWSSTVQAQTAIVLVKNTGQTATGTSGLINAAYPSQAQGFTTGAKPAGYTLSSIGISFRTIGDTTTVGSELTAKLYDKTFDTTFEVDAPNSPLCTLTNPGTFSGSGVHTFDVPTTDPCPTLLPETLYFAVIERANNNTDAIIVDQTISAAEDSGAAAGWQVDGLAFTYDGTEWSEEAAALLIEVKGSVIVPPVLVKNTGQADSGDYGMGVGGNSKRAQAFTTGANPAGYTLGSIGFSFGSITSISTAGGDLAVTLHADSSGDPAGTALCTLTDPGTFSGSGLQTFDALTTDSCGTLEANKTYFAVVQRVANTATSTISLDVTADDNEDTGGATGWTIGDDSYVVVTPGTAWVKNANFNYQVAVRGYANNNPATGAPTITGTPRVGEELTADTSAIMDADGTTPSNFSYQWVRVVGGSTTNIGMDSSTYTLTDDDAEKRIRVDVTFTDDLTNAEGPLSSALSDTIVPADVLVRNTRQTRRSSGEDFDSQSPDVIAQGFTTGANTGGYTLDSIGVHFFSTANNLSPAANRISATLNADGGSEPGAELCSLTNPATFGGSGLHAFAAPTMGTTCPTLHAGTTYWVLLKNDSRTFTYLSATDNDAEDPGGAAGWSIGDGHTQRQGPVSSNPGRWFSNMRPLLIEVKGSAASNNFATGAPSISGVLQQDEVLTADTAGIADADGVGTFWPTSGSPTARPYPARPHRPTPSRHPR